ncbi:MAG: hypothetical protein J2P22_20550 [Nocardioides sp.]|nr:hypothetical protein [Nocardioides sp.]
MGIDVFFDFLDASSGEPLDLAGVLDAVDRQTEEDAYHPVHRKRHLFLIGGGVEAAHDPRSRGPLPPDGG